MCEEYSSSEEQADTEYMRYCQMVWKKIVFPALKLLKSKKGEIVC